MLSFEASYCLHIIYDVFSLALFPYLRAVLVFIHKADLLLSHTALFCRAVYVYVGFYFQNTALDTLLHGLGFKV